MFVESAGLIMGIKKDSEKKGTKSTKDTKSTKNLAGTKTGKTLKSTAGTKTVKTAGSSRSRRAISISDYTDTEYRLAMMGGLVNDYLALYVLDPDAKKLETFYATEVMTGRMENLKIRDLTNYTMFLKGIIGTYVFEDDRKKVSTAASPKNLLAELKEKNSCSVNYRTLGENGGVKYMQWKFTRLGEWTKNKHAILMGVINVDEVVREEMEARYELQRNYSVFKALASQYNSAYIVDLNADSMEVYFESSRIEDHFSGKRTYSKFSEAFAKYANQLVCDADREKVLEAAAIMNLKRQLADKKAYSVMFLDNQNRWCEMKFVRFDDGGDEVKTAALGFSIVDEAVRREKERQLQMQENFEIIKILASEYTAVYYVDLTTCEFKAYSMSEDMERDFGDIFRSGILYPEAFRMYVEKRVYEPDRKMMLKAGSIANIFKELRYKKTFQTPYRNFAVDNTPHYCEMKFVRVGDDDNITAVALAFSDKDKEIRHEQEMQYRIRTDELTGLLNKTGFMRMVQEELTVNSDKLSALIMLDVDKFKSINDTLGHDMGDSVLKSVADVLKESSRNVDLAGRYGGDEFVLLLSDMKDIDTIDRICGRISRRLHFTTAEGCELTSSMGVAIFPEDADDYASLLKCADVAMYQSKNAGGNRYSFYRK